MRKREKDVSPKMLQAAAELLTLNRDVIRVIDAQPPRDEKLPETSGISWSRLSKCVRTFSPKV